MLVSVVVVDWHRADLTVRAVESVLAQRSEHDVEVVLVVNEARDADVARFRRDLPRVVVVPIDRNSGFAGGVTAGIAAARGTVVALLNNDAVADDGFLAHGVAALEAAGPRTAAVAATALLEGTFRPDPDGRDPDDLVAPDGARWRRSEGGVHLVNGTGVVLSRSGNGRDRDWLAPIEGPRETIPVFGFSGGAAFIRREALDQVGGFDPHLFMYYEDVDVSWRLRLTGWDIGHAPHAVVVHRHAASSGSDSPLVRYQSIRNRLAVVLRNATAGTTLRVVLRTTVRALLDLARPDRAQLTPAQWRRLVREAPGLVRHARRARRGDGATRADRRRVEELLEAD
ncbi:MULTISPECIES: glycosyltransferase family 2 protein [unclassified Curtobacterium]|uniref:glycosyltransferase family 2 protein n=1 Tax=unclassified Curtobacterium TaxID=257496 RepID=UPI000DA99F44|nr:MULTISPECIES: glycosyltransferase family 2 protein [unclassified Curtobacterium]WIB62559.1 glycosyltransferase family 2 protein [Curtobacterium sp. MCBD17_040]WIB66396.1 glycosyltransferase family 2 protein [Curtobacterium sp. MCBD17_035]